MRYVIEKDGQLTPATGNPTLKSADGKKQASLRTVMSESWTDVQREKFGVLPLEEAAVPKGKRVTKRTLAKQGKKVVERVTLEDAPVPIPESKPDPLQPIKEKVAALEARVAALENKI